MHEEIKNVDESWKENVAKEKESSGEGKDFIPPEPNFTFFITTLSLQVLVSLGQMANPATNKKEENFKQAKFLIDTLDMLKTKTKGNLSDDEVKSLESVLYELRMLYVSKDKGVKI
ncbi:MAG: DUF1844 domain-containing protein [Candidatus Omnitrophota bacterium]|nr:DUF1844 domain-containing protein [Candidatus Omnitrophota bacterium]